MSTPQYSTGPLGFHRGRAGSFRGIFEEMARILESVGCDDALKPGKEGCNSEAGSGNGAD